MRLSAFLFALAAGLLITAPASAAETYPERFTAACEQGPLVGVLLQYSFSEDKTRPMFCGCFVEAIGNLATPEEEFVVRLLGTLESNAEDQQFFADTGQLVEMAFEECLATLELDPPRD